MVPASRKTVCTRLLWGGLFILLLPANLRAQSSAGSNQAGPFEAAPQRPTFTVNTTTTAPGTLELEFGATGTSSFGGLLALPSNIKFTPDVSGGVFQCAEFSLSFDAASSVAVADRRETQFGDSLSFVIRRPVYRGKALSFAVSPRPIFFLRDNRGLRLGIRAVSEYDHHLDSVVVNFTWTRATSPTPTNTPNEFDIASDYSHTFGDTGIRNRFSVFAGLLLEKPSKQDAAVSLGQGISYRLRSNRVLDCAVRELGWTTGARGYEILAGFTTNFGRLWPE